MKHRRTPTIQLAASDDLVSQAKCTLPPERKVCDVDLCPRHEPVAYALNVSKHRPTSRHRNFIPVDHTPRVPCIWAEAQNCGDGSCPHHDPITYAAWFSRHVSAA